MQAKQRSFRQQFEKLKEECNKSMTAQKKQFDINLNHLKEVIHVVTAVEKPQSAHIPDVS